MEWTPRFPLTAAEKHVDYSAHNTHIAERRAAVERMATRQARQIAFLIVEFHGAPPLGSTNRLGDRLERSLAATARFGYREARREITALRGGKTAANTLKTPPLYNRTTAAYQIPDSGYHARHARNGLDGILRLVHRRSRETALAIADAARKAAGNERDPAMRLAVASVAAAKTLHNTVLELVGETLNMGRTAGVLSLANPPTYALRSEQLDASTCEGCSYEQGRIYQVDSPDYYLHLPPNYCYGGGRCRGIMVYADGIGEVSLPEAA